MVAAARIISEAEDGVSGVVFRGKKANPIVTGFLPILWAHGARIVDTDGKAGLASPAAADALNVYLELAKFALRGVETCNSSEVRDAIQSGATAIAIEVWPSWVPSMDDLNSLVVTLGAAALSLAVGFPAAYALVRLQLPRRMDAAFLVFVLLVKLAPPLVLAIPLYQVLRGIHLLDTLAGLILVYRIYTLPFAIWMLIGFVRDVSPSYEEAAMMDGASLGYRLLIVVLPLMAPGVAATFILLTILAWNEFAYALLFIQTPSNFTLPTFIATLITEDETFWGRLMGIGLVASLPILLMLALFQKHLVRGLAGGLK